MGALLLIVGAVWADTTTPPKAYHMGPNDVIRIQVFGEDDLTVETKVGGDGTIHFPLLGSVLVAGKTVGQVQEYLTTQLAEGYVRSPRVAVFMVRYRNVFVSGEVKTPGGYPYEAGLTVQKAISLAGGFTEKAETRKVTATRLNQNRTDTLMLGLDAPVFPDDILAVGSMQNFYVTGEVVRPGRYPYEDQLSLKKAITLAGGTTDRADPQSVKVTRLKDASVMTLSAESDAIVFADDIIVVEVQSRRFYVSGEVRTPGGYPYRDGLSVQKSIALAGGLTEKADKTGVKLMRANGTAVEMTLQGADVSVMADDLIVVAQAKRFYVNGEVKKPGDFPYEKGLTVHKAVTIAGGFTDKAAKSSTKVLRIINEEERTVEVPLDAPVLPEDIIVVPQRFF
jgi:protein involved in polysaccharide export with SLBB domain